MYGTIRSIEIVIRIITSVFLKFFTAATNDKKNAENSNSLKENCNMVKILGSFSNGNIVNVINVKIIPKSKNSKYQLLSLLMRSSFFNIFTTLIGESNIPITVIKPISYIMKESFLVENNCLNSTFKLSSTSILSILPGTNTSYDVAK